MGPVSSTSTSFINAQLAGQVGVAVAGKVQDAAKAQGEAMLSLMQDAAAISHQEPGKGNLVDIHA